MEEAFENYSYCLTAALERAQELGDEKIGLMILRTGEAFLALQRAIREAKDAED